MVTVLDETKTVDGVETRVVEEREAEGGELIEVSRNYFAIDKTTGDVYYFGEDVDIYRGGKVVGHEGAWWSGVDGAKFGMMMPGKPKVGDKFYQELAPKVAMDRCEVVAVSDEIKTPAGELGAIRWLRANADKYGYDVTRIGVGGGSAGGHLNCDDVLSGSLAITTATSRTDFYSVEHSIQAWVKANRCPAEPKVEQLPDKADDGMTVTRKTYGPGRDGSEVILLFIEGGGHTWPGRETPAKWLGGVTKDISANNLMWEFFQRHPMK